MSQLDSNHWFTEIEEVANSALSLKIEQRLESIVTPYQTIDIYQTAQFGHLMVIDGCIMLTTRENFIYHEMMSHPILFTHPNPQQVLIIGGGDCGTLREVLKHQSVQSVTQIDIDEQVTRLAERYFPELCESNSDPRASIQFADGIDYVRHASAESLDIIVVDSTDPIGPAKGLFNLSFYESCFRALKPDGILVQQSESPLLHMSLLTAMRQSMQQVGFAALQTVNFPQMVYPSGWWSATLAKKTGQFNKIREKDILNKMFNTKYYNLAIHHAATALPNFVLAAFNNQ